MIQKFCARIHNYHTHTDIHVLFDTPTFQNLFSYSCEQSVLQKTMPYFHLDISYLIIMILIKIIKIMTSVNKVTACKTMKE